jgi:ATP-dependent Clp protease protease subunit
VEADTERDYFMSSEDARNYGIIDSAITRKAFTGGPR